MKKKVLILTDYFVPSVKGGGPVQSIKNIVENLSDKLDLFILTSDRDIGEKQPYHTVKPNQWIEIGKAKVYYINPSKLSMNKLNKIIKEVNCNVLYLNGFFSYRFSIFPVLLNRLNKNPSSKIVIAPRGEFSKGALNLKRTKKKIYITIAKVLNLYRDITWHATAETEKKDIVRVLGEKINVKIASNLTANYSGLKYEKNLEKSIGALKIVFFSRIHPKKNLKFGIEILNNLIGKVELNIYGPLEDKKYWSECEQVINALPDHIRVTYKGMINHQEILNMLSRHHLFLFPTLGENFGHVISEALIGGCPVIISDQTPWQGLEKLQVGWDIPLNNKDKFIETLQYCVNLDQTQYNLISKKAFEYGKVSSNRNEDIIRMYDILAK